MIWLLILFLTLVYTELVGYVVHRLLHAGSLGRLSDLHDKHHLEVYPSEGPFRTETYLYPERSGILKKIGAEWFFPLASISIPTLILLFFIGVSPWYLLFAVGISSFWAWLAFAYMHRSFHLKEFWMTKNYISKSWYTELRRLHDIHHIDMKKNYGITFFWYDKLLETFTRKLVKDGS